MPSSVVAATLDKPPGEILTSRRPALLDTGMSMTPAETVTPWPSGPEVPDGTLTIRMFPSLYIHTGCTKNVRQLNS